MQITKAAIIQVLGFLADQLLCTIGVPVLAAFLTFSVAPVFRPFLTSPITAHQASAALTETPGFPIQMGFGFVLGTTVGYWLKYKSAQWVWVLPFLALSIAFISLPVSVLEPNSVSGRIGHFFGTTCQPRVRCFDQIAVTLPTIAAISYAVGNFVGIRLRNRNSVHLASPEGHTLA